MILERVVTRTENFVKGMLFDCRGCGQCVLSSTGMVCPMTCPKGLRNGPCGGTLGRGCEVHPENDCVWVRIHARRDGHSLDTPPLMPSVDADLLQTSSFLNLFTGKDRQARTPLSYLDLGTHRTALPVRTKSRLEARLKSGAFVHTSEIRSPREAGFGRVKREAAALRVHFDAFNATAYLGARPSIPSSGTAAVLAGMGIETISQATCRDHTKTSFISELMQNEANSVHNILCLTGDAFQGSPASRQVFDMDAALMLYEARHLQERGRIHFTDTAVRRPPRPFLGAAINPFTSPVEVPIRRAKQKAAAGADFIQSQLVFDIDAFRQFMSCYTGEGVDQDLFFLAGIPVVISEAAWKHVFTVPGVTVPNAIKDRLNGASDIRTEGVALARELIAAVRATPGVNGVHLMLFGTDSSALIDVIKESPE